MDALTELIGLTSQEFMQLVIVGIILVVGLFILRAAFKLTATLLRMGCIGIVIGLYPSGNCGL